MSCHMKAPAETRARPPAGKSLISSLDIEAALVRLPGTWSPVCWKCLLVVTGKDEWMSQRCNKSALVGKFVILRERH